jgi:Trp operon repressor
MSYLTIPIEERKAFCDEYKTVDHYTHTFISRKPLRSLMEGMTVAEFETVIELAVDAIKGAKNSMASLQFNDVLSLELKKQNEKHKKDVEQLLKKESLDRESMRSSLVSAMTEKETELRELKASLSASDTMISKLREQLKGSESMFRASLDDVVKQKEKQYEKELERMSESHKRMMEVMESSANQRVESLRTVYQEQEDKLRKQLERTLVSSEKGKVGEREFDDLVAQYTSWGELTNTAKTSYGTDRAGKIRGCDVLFELKNYNGEVPSAEVEKFERDMEEHSDVPFGVFISYKSGIRGKKSDGFLAMKWTSRSQLLLFINNFYNHVPEDTLKMIDVMADIAWMVYKSSRDKPTDSEQCAQLQSRIQQAKVFVEKELKRMELFLVSLNHDKSFLIETITKQNATYVYNITQCAQALHTMLDILLMVPKQEPEGIVETLPEPPLKGEEEAKTKKRSKKSVATK